MQRVPCVLASCLLVGAAVAGCQLDDSDTVRDVDSVACDTLSGNGKTNNVTADTTSRASSPTVDRHTRQVIALPASGTGYVIYFSDNPNQNAVILLDKAVPLTVMTVPGMAVSATSMRSTVPTCAAARVRNVYILPQMAPYYLQIGPTAEMTVSMVIESDNTSQPMR
jgi:hypothetical protein